MGMSASQARFLQLTARKSDVEYEVQQVDQKRVLLNNKADQIQEDYSEKTNNQMVVFKSKDLTTTAELDYASFSTNDVFKGMYLTDSAGRHVVADKSEIPEGANKAYYIVDENLTKLSYFQKNLQEGNFLITVPNSDNIGEAKSLASFSFIQETYDESDDAAAKATYDLEMQKLQRDDKRLELRIEALETEHKAIETEMESVDKVIQKNIEDTFKTFA